MTTFRFDPSENLSGMMVLREEVRTFLSEHLQNYSATQRARSWDGFDREFSRAVGRRGWIGMTWPTIYGGGGRSSLERYVVMEEMLAAGAPVSAHWFADRQSGPLLLKYGTEKQRQEILPRIARGELVFSIGLSEPNAGSDLSAIHTKANRVDGGWSINGNKVWTTNALHADYMVALVRTDVGGDQRHQGFSQFLIDMTLPGITVRPIQDLTGDAHFNEVFFDDLFVSEDCLVGVEGDGWNQAMAELAYERSGPERFLSSIQVLFQLIAEVAKTPDEEQIAVIGRMTAELTTLRQMSISIASMLERGLDPALEAAVVKDLGARFEQSLPEMVQSLLGYCPDGNSENTLQQVLVHLVKMAPAFSLRGGASEILRGIIARGLKIR